MTERNQVGVQGDSKSSALGVAHLTKTFAGVKALDDVHLAVQSGEIHAVVGENGSGKSTLIKVLSGFHVPDPGTEISVAGGQLPLGNPAASHRAGFRFVHQDLGLIDSLSIADNLSMGKGYPCRLGTIRRRRWREDVSNALQSVHLDVDPDQLVGQLASATKVGVALARALQVDEHSEPAVLVLDEPTAALPWPQIAELHRMVRLVASRGTGVLYVSHHLQEIFELADRVTVLRDGCNVASLNVKDIDHSGLVHHIVGSDLEPDPTQAPSSPEHPRPPLLEIRKLSRWPLRALNLTVRPGEIVGFAGIAGSGREQALSAAFGATPRDAGDVILGGQPLAAGSPGRSMALGMAYLPADRRVNGGVMNLSAGENLTLAMLRDLWRFPMLRRRRERDTTTRWFNELDVRPASGGDERLSTFSGGNQQKILLAKWLRREPTVLLLDEPTQGVDIAAKALIHRQLTAAARRGACVVISSSDHEELVALCDRVLVFSGGMPCAEISGTLLTNAALTRAALGTTPDVRP